MADRRLLEDGTSLRLIEGGTDVRLLEEIAPDFSKPGWQAVRQWVRWRPQPWHGLSASPHQGVVQAQTPYADWRPVRQWPRWRPQPHVGFTTPTDELPDGDTRLTFSFDVVEPSGGGIQRLVFDFDVIEPVDSGIRLVFAFNVVTTAQSATQTRLLFCFDVIPSELYDASLADLQRPIAEVTKTPDADLNAVSFEVTSNLATPADRWTATFTGTGPYRSRTLNDRYTLRSGLVESGTRRLYTLIRDGIPDFHTAELTPRQASTTTISGRDGMMYLQDGRFSRIYRYGPQPGLVAGQNPIQEVSGLFRASDIARDVVTAGGLILAWQCPDYYIWKRFQAVGRPLDILVNLVRPFSLVEARKVDVFSEKSIVYVRQRRLNPTAWAAMTISAHDLRISSLRLRSFETPKIGRVTLRGRVRPGSSESNNSGVMPTPPGGVPIPHDTELLPFGGGAPIAIYSGPVTDEAILLPSSQPMPIGTVKNPDGSTLGVGTVSFTEQRFVVNPESTSWVLPTGTVLRPDGLFEYTDSGFTITVPPSFVAVQNSDGTVTTVHP